MANLKVCIQLPEPFNFANLTTGPNGSDTLSTSEALLGSLQKTICDKSACCYCLREEVEEF